DEAENLAKTASEKCADIKARIIERKEAALKQAKKLFSAAVYEEIEPALALKKEELSAELSGLKERYNTVTAKAEKRNKLAKDIPAKEGELETLNKRLTGLEKDKAAKESEKTAIEKSIAELSEKLSFSSESEAKKNIETLIAEKAKIDIEIKKADEEYQNKDKEVSSLKETIKNLGNLLKDSVETDIEALTREYGEKAEELRILREKQQTVITRLAADRSVYDGIRKKSGEVSETEKKLTWVKALSDTANGTVSGKEKIMLETYVQMTYFERIIARANTRFLVMSGGQYELVRRKEAGNNRSQSGLDLDVMDHYNGSVRSVRTLSGGESFMASLSLALGLSDEIQSSAGGIKLDTMFVDEGFGSLDGDALGQAMRALEGLTQGNRLVVIISHVDELKSRIDKQIVVTKDKSGGSKAVIEV
ncbi:MAG: SMC family ATPase, partial [Clostridia bacterium]|nr:SMC family ATPase [Clostridia bacterium]